MFGEIASRYDLGNALTSFGLHHRWRKIAAAKLHTQPGALVLDLCAGTGDFARCFDRPPISLDFSAEMLAVNRAKNPDAALCLADAGQICLQDQSVDGVCVGWGIRNVPSPDMAHAEIFRVLKPGRRFVSIDCAIPANPILRVGSKAAMAVLMPLVGFILRNSDAYKYLPKSTDRFADRESLKRSMEAAGFTQVGYQDLFLGNICIHWGTKP